MAGVGYSTSSSKQYKQFEEALRALIPQTIRIFESQMNRIPLEDQPTEVSVEFGVLLTANASIVLTESNSESTLKVTLTWINDDNDNNLV